MAIMEGLQEDMGEASMQCTDHPSKTTTPGGGGGICAVCLQEKLGKLVSSSSAVPMAVFPSSSSSPSPSFRSHFGAPKPIHPSLPLNPSSSSSTAAVNHHHHQHPTCNINGCRYRNSFRRTRIPFFTQKKEKKKDLSPAAATDRPGIVFKRSKSSIAPRHAERFTAANDGDDNSPRKRGFWSFLYFSKHLSNHRKTDKRCEGDNFCCASSSTAAVSLDRTSSQRSTRERKVMEEFVAAEENESPDTAAFERKVSRSRSVGCGSRSFSGDFFERISIGFGDCTLRRVESQREGKPKVTPVHRGGGGGVGQEYIKERVKCRGIFSGLMMITSSSSSSSSAEENNINGKAAPAATPAAAGNLAHGRSKSWGWAFASPRAFRRPPRPGPREGSNKSSAIPNLNAIPSLLVVKG
ncbi:hypothetical protein U1Q18_015726 [Sarracenia purpurea var. burkii]